MFFRLQAIKNYHINYLKWTEDDLIKLEIQYNQTINQTILNEVLLFLEKDEEKNKDILTTITNAIASKDYDKFTQSYALDVLTIYQQNQEIIDEVENQLTELDSNLLIDLLKDMPQKARPQFLQDFEAEMMELTTKIKDLQPQHIQE